MLSVRTIVTPGTPCPAVTADGAAVAARKRLGPDDRFPLELCDARVAPDSTGITAGDQPVPALPRAIRRIVVIGDTGCRIARSVTQDCRDPQAWPFPAVAAAAAARHPDLVIHVGDYYYRETACPAGNTGCADSPHGDNWAAWQADFFDPAAPLLAAAPWVMLRGNHELCARGGQGWFRLLDPYAGPRPGPAGCADMTPPYTVSAGGLDLLVFDDAAAADVLASPEKVVLYAGQLAPLLAQAPSGSWLVMHRPVWAMGPAPLNKLLPGLSTNQTMQAAIRGLIPPALDLVLSGHVHDFLSYDFGPQRPAQLVVGTGGDTLLALGEAPIVGAEIDGMTVRRGFATERFGYFIMERDGAGWDGTLYAPDDSVIARCRLAGRDLACSPSG
jgi:hypothetical protein